jgi:hypothetical protein
MNCLNMIRLWHISPVATRVGRFFDEPRVELRQFPDPCDRLRDVPNLIGVDHHVCVGSHFVAEDAAAPKVILEVAADLDLEVRPTALLEVAALFAERLVAVAEPTGGGGVAGVTGGDEFLDPRRFRRLLAAKDFDRLAGGDRVGEVTEIDAIDELFGGHLADQSPDRLPFRPGPQIPNGIDHRGGG